jgi:hypothetical protein
MNDFLPIESVLYQIKNAEGRPFELTYYSFRSKERKTKKFLYRSVKDIKGEGTMTMTDPKMPDVPMTIKIGFMLEICFDGNNKFKIKH